MAEPEQQMEETGGFLGYLRRWVTWAQQWIRPDPADHPLLRVGKLALKSVALLVMIALSPVILVVMLFVFFAAL